MNRKCAAKAGRLSAMWATSVPSGRTSSFREDSWIRHPMRSALRVIASGVYQAIVSEYDRGIGFDDAWLGRLVQVYKERQTMAVAKAKGYVFKGREVIDTPQGKKIQLRFAVR